MKYPVIRFLAPALALVVDACTVRPAVQTLPTFTLAGPTAKATLGASSGPVISTLSIVASGPPFNQTSTPYATPTEFRLPFNDKDVESTYCQSPNVRLSLADAQDMSSDQIVAELLKLWLAYFNAPRAPDWCRVGGYRIEQIYYDRVALNGPIDPQGDIMRVVRFTVKLVQVPSYWMSWSGEVDQQNWLHLALSVAVFRRETGYTMQFAYP